jgi:hypothetical protein
VHSPPFIANAPDAPDAPDALTRSGFHLVHSVRCSPSGIGTPDRPIAGGRQRHNRGTDRCAGRRAARLTSVAMCTVTFGPDKLGGFAISPNLKIANSKIACSDDHLRVLMLVSGPARESCGGGGFAPPKRRVRDLGPVVQTNSDRGVIIRASCE